MMRESEIQAAIMVALGARADIRLWRQNVGVARPLSNPGSVVRYGVPGQSDIGGVYTHNGIGVVLQIEVKAARGRVAPEQIKWLAMIERMGGIAVVARSVDDVLDALEAWRGKWPAALDSDGPQATKRADSSTPRPSGLC
jgi:hypothetical protein